jgi:hypothetical protein
MGEYVRIRYLLALAGAIMFSTALSAQAGTINIQATDQELTYQDDGTGNVYDSPDLDGGNLDPTEADLLNAIQFNLNGNAPPASGGNNVFVSNGGTGYYGDFLINDAGTSIPISGVMLSAIGGGGPEFGFDLFSSTGGVSTAVLRLHFDSMNILLNSGVVLISGKADIVSQNLPFGLVFDANQQVDFAYTATGPGISGTATDASLFVAGGTINISGADVIPEPTSLLMLLSGVTGLGLVAVRRRV